MTKKDYIKIANIIKNSKAGIYQHSPVLWEKTFIIGLCEVLKEDNPRFDIDQFMAACK